MLASMPTAWDRRTPLEQRRVQNVQLKQTILQAALGYVPAVRARLAAMGKDARLFKGTEELPSLPAMSRRDVFDPKRNPEGPDGICLYGSEEGVKRFSDRATLRRIARARLIGGEQDATLAIESATRAIHLHMVPGPGGRVPVAYTRDDLDLFARAGHRLAQVLGITREDRIANLIPGGPSLEHWQIVYLAMGLGARAIHTGEGGVRGLRLAAGDRSTVLVAPIDDFAELLEQAAEAELDLTSIRLLVPVGGSLTLDERERIADAARALELGDALIACAYGPAEGRVLWGECAVPIGHSEGFGFHTYPDLDVVEILDPETGLPLPDGRPGDITVTSLGFRGGGLPRWRSGDLAVGGVVREACPNCGRTVPRVGPGIKRAAWQQVLHVDGVRRWIDLSIVAAVTNERATDWFLETPNGAHSGLFVHLAGVSDASPVIELFSDLERIGMEPTQIVSSTPQVLAARLAERLPPWRRIGERNGSEA